MQIVPAEKESFDKWVAINDDPYGKACVDYAIRWANLMEQHMAAGAKLEDIADNDSHAADTEGITGFMYGAACGGLAKFWIHGDQLRRWHNAKYGVTEEQAKGGTVNPAIITIEEKT